LGDTVTLLRGNNRARSIYWVLGNSSQRLVRNNGFNSVLVSGANTSVKIQNCAFTPGQHVLLNTLSNVPVSTHTNCAQSVTSQSVTSDHTDMCVLRVTHTHTNVQCGVLNHTDMCTTRMPHSCVQLYSTARHREMCTTE